MSELFPEKKDKKKYTVKFKDRESGACLGIIVVTGGQISDVHHGAVLYAKKHYKKHKVEVEVEEMK